MNQTEIVNPPHPGKLELIEQVASRIAGPWRFIDLGGLWAVHGVYAFHALAQRGCLGGTEVDTHPTGNFVSALANEPRLTYVQGNFGDADVFAQLPPFDVVFLFDTLLHQVRPDWHEILSMYAARASHILIFNQQYTGEQTVRLLDLGEDAYFSNVPHDRAHSTYADLFRKLDQKHPAHDRNWRDVHHIWQWGITDDDLIATMAALGFEPVFSRNWGQVLDLARFENHAFIFSRVAPRAIAPTETASSTPVSSTNATPQTDASILLPDPLSTLAAIDDDGTLTAKSAGEQLRLLRGYRRMLRPGGTLRVEAVDDETRAQLVDRARYAGFVDAAHRSGALTLRTPDHRLGAGEVPLVTVAIPAFKPAHFSASLESALAQTYPRLHILVCDDSGGDLLQRIADRHRADDRIEWVTNPVNIGGRANFIQCLERARGDFIKFLCDDDLLEPDCVEHMVAAFRRDPEATLVFSRRQRIDDDGAPLPDDHHTEALAEHDCVFRGEALAGAVIALQSNFIGEPTTVMFRRADLAWIRPHYASFDGHDDIRVVGDIATWHNLLSQGEAVYLARPLSRFRIHPGQNQARPEIRELIAESWAKVDRGSRSLGFVQDPHPPVPHREPGKREWRIDPTLPLNRRLAARSNGVRTTAGVEPLAEAVIQLADAALAAEPAAPKGPVPQADRQRYDAAAALMAAGHVTEAAEALIALATEESPVWEVYADLAEIALKQDDRDAALELMLAATTLAPDCARAAFGASMLQAGRGDFEAALATLSPVLREHPNDTEALTLVRRILGAAPELSAVTWARLLTDLRHEAVSLRATVSRHEAALQTLRGLAAAAAQPAIPYPPRPPRSAAPDTVAPPAATAQEKPLPPIGTPAMQITDIDSERQQLETARSLIAKDQLADAADILTAMVLAETPLSGAYLDLGCLAVRQGDLETAASLFGIALKRDPDSVSARRNLALVQGIEQRYEEALATLSPILRSGVAGNDDYGLVRDILGKAPALGPIAWARLLADLRRPSDEQRRMLDDYDRMRDELAALRAATIHHQPGPQSRPSNTIAPSCADAGSNAPAFLAALGYLNAHGLTGFKWFSDAASYLAWDMEVKDRQAVIERHIADQTRFPGYCGLCQQATMFTVSGGIQLEGHTHLREGMLCEHCHTHNRARVLGLSIEHAASAVGDGARVLLMEATTPLYDHLSRRLPNLIGSEFLSGSVQGGALVSLGGRTVRHENILRLSFADQSLDVIAHADLLEHVPDVETALAECFRVLKTGGQLVFSAPFSQTMSVSRKRATLNASGDITHLFPAEYHGTHLAYYNFGWDLLEMCRNAGFSGVRLGVCLDPLQGLLSTGRFGGYFMQPIIISCTR